MEYHERVWAVPVALAALGLAVMVIGTGGAAWPLAVGWTLVAVIVAVVERRVRAKRTRVFVALIGIVGLPILVFEGGLLMWPAAVGLLVASAVAPRPSPHPSV